MHSEPLLETRPMNDGAGLGFAARAFQRKPLVVVHAEEANNKLPRTLSFWDLLAIGVGGTVGSGVFVLSGLIARRYAGPAGALSWIVAGIGCLISGLSYAELSGRIPSAGAGYAYTFVAIGELPAVLVACLVTLEYGISGAATARSWGDKMSLYIRGAAAPDADLDWLLEPGGINLMAVLMQAACVGIVLCGMDASKRTVNFFCILKLGVILFMVIVAFSLYRPENLIPFAPAGGAGVMRGAVAAIFGYLGFDEVCLLTMEAKDPHRSVPRALVASIGAVGLIFVAVSLALCGVLPSADLDEDAGFPQAFAARGAHWAYHLASLGEIVTLPLIVLVSFMAQPRLQYALAEDGLLPAAFGAVTSSGTLRHGSLLAGIACILVAAFVPFQYLDEVISSGVLLSFNFTNAALIVMRNQPYGPPMPLPGAAHRMKADGGNGDSGDGTWERPCGACGEDAACPHDVGGSGSHLYRLAPSTDGSSSGNGGGGDSGNGGDGNSGNGGNGSSNGVGSNGGNGGNCSDSSWHARTLPLDTAMASSVGAFATSGGLWRARKLIRPALSAAHRTADVRARVAALNVPLCIAGITGAAAAAAARRGHKSAAAFLLMLMTLAGTAAAVIVLGIQLYAGEPPGDTHRALSDDGYPLFRVPGVPWLPAIGIALNYYLIAQQSALSWAILLGYLAFAAAFYLCYGLRHSVGGNTGWAELIEERSISAGDGSGGDSSLSSTATVIVTSPSEWGRPAKDGDVSSWGVGAATAMVAAAVGAVGTATNSGGERKGSAASNDERSRLT
ncbi:unnamed protein product [Phaeothamnion confervicola]